MIQRQTVQVPPAPATLAGTVLAHQAAAYMLRTHIYDSPLDWIDVPTLARELYARGTKDELAGLKAVKTDVVPDSLEAAMGILTVYAASAPTAAVLDFHNGNALAVVGSRTSFYVIDLKNGLFYPTSAPEYDADRYEHGDNAKFTVEYYRLAAKRPRDEDDEPVVAAAQAPPKVTKKKKAKLVPPPSPIKPESPIIKVE